MKKASILALIFVLTATLFAGCRNMGNNTTGTNMTPASSSSSTMLPLPERPLPSGPSTTNPGGAMNPSDSTTTPGVVTEPGTSGINGRSARPSARGPRY